MRRDREENSNYRGWEQKLAGGGVGDATMPLEKKSQASESEREECEEKKELLWLHHHRERERVVVESVRKRRKTDGFYYNNAIGHSCKNLQKCHRSFEQRLNSAKNIFKLFSIWAIWVSFEQYIYLNPKGENKCQTNKIGLRPTIFWIQTQKTVFEFCHQTCS